jgi:2-polyprenyl-6-hydroxyphenyl methylase/3-demethylubiquinone-9 3-methyltransferase
MADHAQFKEGSKQIWGMGDYKPIADLLLPAARSLIDAAAISAGQEILDVAAGTGNLALLAAEEGADVTATDFAPEMVELGKARTEADDVDVEWLVADAEDLPFEDASFECVASVMGMIFAPRPEVAIAEMFRVVKPGNTVAFTAWGDYGPNARIFNVSSKYRAWPQDFPDPQLWGEEEVVRERLGPHAGTIEPQRRSVRFEFDDEDAAWQVFSNNGPQKAMIASIGPEKAAEFKADLLAALREENDLSGGRIGYDAEYLEVVARKRG